MKNLLTILILFISFNVTGQKQISSTYKVTPGQKIVFKFDYPELIRISSWDKKEIQITGQVNINEGMDNDAFILEEKSTENSIIIRNRINNIETLSRYVVRGKDDKKKIFSTKEAFEKFNNENGGNIKYSLSSEINVTLDIKIPASMEAEVKSTYGMVELVDVDNSITVDATYKGIDATLSEKSIGQLTVITEFGSIYANLDLPITSNKKRDFYTSLTFGTGQGNVYKFTSTYGKIYMRKSGK